MLTTQRIRLRQWRDEDFPAFAALNADPEVRTFLGPLQSREESDAAATKFRDAIAAQGWGLWAAEVVGGAPFIGFVGMAPVPFDARFTPAVEIGWRLAREHWGKGYATEAAVAVTTFAFDHLKLRELVSFTVNANIRSRHVMERLGMTHDPTDDFDHPKLTADNPLRPHVLYRLSPAK